MKKIFIALASVFFMLSCSQEERILPAQEKNDTTSVLSVAQSQLKFAKLLSQAASNSVEVRSFLKKEALEQFDNDYDIFYPLVKNKVVYGDRTFRDILLSYCEKGDELSQIEQSLLLLNILVPDLSLFGDFSARSWDVSDTEIAVICRDDETNTLYENGENIGQVAGGDIPDFPCLVVKNNERMKVSSVNTRSGEATYEFVNDAFDGSKRAPQTRHSDRDEDFETPDDLTLGIDQSVFRAPLVEAWNEFKNVPDAAQRDYIYYGLTKANKPGKLNKYIREELYRFRIESNVFSLISDQKGSDPFLAEPSQEKRYLTHDEILKKIWTEGSFDFRFKAYIASANNTIPILTPFAFSVDPRDAFSIDKIHIHHKNSTGFRHSKNFYTVDSRNLKSKWIYTRSKDNPSAIVLSLPWDLLAQSNTLHLFIEEFDDSQTIKESRQMSYQFTSKTEFTTETTSGDKEKTTVKTTHGTSSTYSEVVNIEISTTKGSDDLGTLTFNFYDPVILSKGNSANTYNVYSAFNGKVEATLLPVDLRK